ASACDPYVWSGRVLQLLRVGGCAVLHQCIRPLIGAFCAPGHHGYQRACGLISGQASTGHLGHQCSHAPGRPILHLVFILSQTSAGTTFRRLALRSRGLNPDCLECSTMSQDAPRNASELVGECDGEDVVMQSLLGRFEPRLEPVTIPALRPDQYSPSGLNEQNTQVAVAAFRYFAKDGAVAGRDLVGNKAQPSSEVAAFRERKDSISFDRRSMRSSSRRQSPARSSIT